VDLSNLAQNRSKCPAVVNQAMKSPVPKMWEIFCLAEKPAHIFCDVILLQ
jgi:hypothetical protein